VFSLGLDGGNPILRADSALISDAAPDPKSEENEESRLDVKDGLQDGLQDGSQDGSDDGSEDGDDEESLTFPPKEGKERFYESPSVEAIDSDIASPESTVRLPILPAEIGILRNASTCLEVGPFTTALCHDNHLASCVLGEKEEGVTGSKPMKTTVRCPTAKGPVRLLTTCLAAPPAFPAPAGMDVTSEERRKSRLTADTVLPFMTTPRTHSYLSPNGTSYTATMRCIACAAAAVDMIVEGEEDVGLVGKGDSRYSAERIYLEDVADWIMARRTAGEKEGKRWTWQALSWIPESAPSELRMDFVGPVICLPVGCPSRFIMTAHSKDGGKESNSFTDFVGPLAPAFIAPLACEFRLTFEFIAPASVCKSSVDSGPAVASLSMTGRWKDGGKEFNSFADFVLLAMLPSPPPSHASFDRDLTAPQRFSPLDLEKITTLPSTLSQRFLITSWQHNVIVAPASASIAESSRIMNSSQSPRYDDLESEVGLDWPRQVLPRLYTTPPKILYE
jgi:hypothetical protein